MDFSKSTSMARENRRRCQRSSATTSRDYSSSQKAIDRKWRGSSESPTRPWPKRSPTTVFEPGSFSKVGQMSGCFVIADDPKNVHTTVALDDDVLHTLSIVGDAYRDE